MENRPPRRRGGPAVPTATPPQSIADNLLVESEQQEGGIKTDDNYDSNGKDSSGKAPSSKIPRSSAWTVFAVISALVSLSYFATKVFHRTCEDGSSPPCRTRVASGEKEPGLHGWASLTALEVYSNSTGLEPDGDDNRPYYDLIVAVLVVGGDSAESLAEIDRVRRVYGRYGTSVTPDGGGSNERHEPLSFRYVFVVGAGALGEAVDVPQEGLLRGDFFFVDVPEGYRYLSHKTKALMGLSEHMRFKFLAKTDGDTFPCLGRVTQQLMEMPIPDHPRVYAGLLATCGKLFPPGHKLHDPEFLKATGGVLPCHPMYHQGAFYILGEDIVRHLFRSREVLTIMSVEDAMMGLWLLGIDKVILDIGGQFYCQCFTHPVPQQLLDRQSFYHFCKTDEKIDGCLQKFGIC